MHRGISGSCRNDSVTEDAGQRVLTAPRGWCTAPLERGFLLVVRGESGGDLPRAFELLSRGEPRAGVHWLGCRLRPRPSRPWAAPCPRSPSRPSTRSTPMPTARPRPAPSTWLELEFVF